MSKITSLEKFKTVSYDSVTHKDFWLKRDISKVPSIPNTETAFTPKNSVVCVMSESLDNRTAEQLFNLAEQENRVYILVDSISKDMEENLQKKCLIRRGKNITGSFILDMNKKIGFFSNGAMNTLNIFRLSLDKEQIEILYRYFCCSFWQTEPNSPIDIFPNYDNFCDSSFIQKIMTGRKTIAFVPIINSSNDSAKIITSLTGNIVQHVRQIANNGTRILALKNGNFIHALENEDGMFVIPKTDITPDKVSWALKLNESQKNIVKGYLRSIEENADYEFFAAKTRTELAEKDILPLGGENGGDIRIERSKLMDLKAHVLTALLPFEDFDVAEPENFEDDGTSVSIAYKWTNVPYTLPSGSKKHQLYENWGNKIKEIGNFLSEILKRIDDVEKKESNLAKAISRFFLGKKTKFDSLKTETNELKNFDFANTVNDKLKEKIARINEIYHQLRTDIEEIEEENRKAKIEEEIEAKKEELKKLEGERNKEKELQEKQRDIETQSMLQETLQKELNGLNSEKKLLENEIASLQTRIKQLAEDERKPFEAQLADKQKILQEKESAIVNQSSKQKELKKQLEDLKVAKNKITNERDDKNNKIKRLNSEIDSLNRQLKSSVKEKQNDNSALSNLKGGGKKPNQSGPVNDLLVPQLPHLPHIGELFQHNGQNYLAITDWEEYNKGKEEAKRLNAKLCTKGENHG